MQVINWIFNQSLGTAAVCFDSPVRTSKEIWLHSQDGVRSWLLSIIPSNRRFFAFDIPEEHGVMQIGIWENNENVSIINYDPELKPQLNDGIDLLTNAPVQFDCLSLSWPIIGYGGSLDYGTGNILRSQLSVDSINALLPNLDYVAQEVIFNLVSDNTIGPSFRLPLEFQERLEICISMQEKEGKVYPQVDLEGKSIKNTLDIIVARIDKSGQNVTREAIVSKKLFPGKTESQVKFDKGVPNNAVFDPNVSDVLPGEYIAVWPVRNIEIKSVALGADPRDIIELATPVARRSTYHFIDANYSNHDYEEIGRKLLEVSTFGNLSHTEIEDTPRPFLYDRFINAGHHCVLDEHAKDRSILLLLPWQFIAAMLEILDNNIDDIDRSSQFIFAWPFGAELAGQYSGFEPIYNDYKSEPLVKIFGDAIGISDSFICQLENKTEDQLFVVNYTKSKEELTDLVSFYQGFSENVTLQQCEEIFKEYKRLNTVVWEKLLPLFLPGTELHESISQIQAYRQKIERHGNTIVSLTEGGEKVEIFINLLSKHLEQIFSERAISIEPYSVLPEVHALLDNNALDALKKLEGLATEPNQEQSSADIYVRYIQYYNCTKPQLVIDRVWVNKQLHELASVVGWLTSTVSDFDKDKLSTPGLSIPERYNTENLLNDITQAQLKLNSLEDTGLEFIKEIPDYWLNKISKTRSEVHSFVTAQIKICEGFPAQLYPKLVKQVISTLQLLMNKLDIFINQSLFSPIVLHLERLQSKKGLSKNTVDKKVLVDIENYFKEISEEFDKNIQELNGDIVELQSRIQSLGYDVDSFILTHNPNGAGYSVPENSSDYYRQLYDYCGRIDELEERKNKLNKNLLEVCEKEVGTMFNQLPSEENNKLAEALSDTPSKKISEQRRRYATGGDILTKISELALLDEQEGIRYLSWVNSGILSPVVVDFTELFKIVQKSNEWILDEQAFEKVAKLIKNVEGRHDDISRELSDVRKELESEILSRVELLRAEINLLPENIRSKLKEVNNRWKAVDFLYWVFRFIGLDDMHADKSLSYNNLELGITEVDRENVIQLLNRYQLYPYAEVHAREVEV